MFEEFVNLFEKKKSLLKEPEYYDDKVFVINRWLSNDKDMMEAVAALSKYLFVLRGRYYFLLYHLIPETVRKFIKYPKKDILGEKERKEVRALQRVYNYSGREAYTVREILIKEGVDVRKMFGLNNKGASDGTHTQGTEEQAEPDKGKKKTAGRRKERKT